MSDYDELLDQARIHYGVPLLETTDAVMQWLVGLGAHPIEFALYKEDLSDEFVDGTLVDSAFVLRAPDLLRKNATEEELENFQFDVDEVFDPNEYGVENALWTTYSHEVATLQALLIVTERGAHSVDEPGSFRIYGAGQWLREALWAGTGVIPRDPGSPGPASGLFEKAFQYSGRDPFSADPVRS